jgi:nicotinamide-nucleotide adenylyltransferase
MGSNQYKEQNYAFFGVTPSQNVASFNLEDQKHFHTDKMADFLVSKSFEQVLTEHLPFVSFQCCFITESNEYLLKNTSSPFPKPQSSHLQNFGPSLRGLIPFGKAFSYEFVETTIKSQFRNNYPSLKITMGHFHSLKLIESSTTPAHMNYSYVGIVHPCSHHPSTHLSQKPHEFIDLNLIQEEFKERETNPQKFSIDDDCLIDMLKENLFTRILSEYKTKSAEETTNFYDQIEFDSIGAIVGRFQPFHNGHLNLLLTMLKYHQQIKIGIGSSQYHHSQSNPFTYEERKQMISDSLADKDIPHARYHIFAIPDLHNYSKWLKKVIETLTPFELFYSNSSWIRQIIDDTGLKIAPKAIFNFSHYNGTNVRKCLMESQSIKNLVPSAVLIILSTIDALSRLN